MNFLYEGKAKRIFKTELPNEIIISFKDDATAFNGQKKDILLGKGRLNLKFTRLFFELLESKKIKTHIIEFIDDTTMRAQFVNIIPLEVVVRNYAAGSICKREGFEKGYQFSTPLCEFFYKDDSLGDPIISESEILERKMLTADELNYLRNEALKINEILATYVDTKGIILVDFKIEFGKIESGEIILADEISPDTCRFWDKNTMESLDKDVFRENKADLVSSYSKLAEVIGVEI